MYETLAKLAPQQVFLIQGNKNAFASLLNDLKSNSIFVEGEILSRFTMEDANNIVSFNLQRGAGSWYVVYFDVFVNNASQVLLKTLEEPNEGIMIVFVTPHPYLIPQTIRSRARLISTDLKNDIPKYLSSKKDILEYVKDIFGDDSVEASIRRAEATVFLDQLEQYFKNNPEKIKYIYETKDMLFKANMPTKQVIEYLISIIY
jgi:DNA polymerase III delta prime subunit